MPKFIVNGEVQKSPKSPLIAVEVKYSQLVEADTASAAAHQVASRNWADVSLSPCKKDLFGNEPLTGVSWFRPSYLAESQTTRFVQVIGPLA